MEYILSQAHIMVECLSDSPLLHYIDSCLKYQKSLAVRIEVVLFLLSAGIPYFLPREAQ